MAIDNRKLRLLHRRKAVASRYLRGQTQWDIANALECTQSTISADLKAIQEQWEAHALESRRAWIGRLLASMEEVKEAAWQAWKKSQDSAETLRAKMRGGVSETEKISKAQAGDPRFLALVRQCDQDIAVLLGLQKLSAASEIALDGPIEFIEVQRSDPCRESNPA